MTIARQFFSMLDEGDGVEVFFLTLAMLYLGKISVGIRPSVHRSASYACVLVSAAYALSALAAYGEMQPACLIGITWRTLLAAAIVYGLAAMTITMAIVLIELPARVVSRWIHGRFAIIARRRKDRRDQAEQYSQQRLAQERDRQLAPMREQERRNAEAARAQRAQLDEVRRKLRFQCQLSYNRFRPEVIGVFPQDEYHRLVEDALKATNASDLEEAVTSLLDTLCGVLGGGKDDEKDDSLMSIAADFDTRRAAVENSNYSAERKDDLIKYLNIQEAKEITRALEQ